MSCCLSIQAAGLKIALFNLERVWLAYSPGI
jgi:hypothetical protein